MLMHKVLLPLKSPKTRYLVEMVNDGGKYKWYTDSVLNANYYGWNSQSFANDDNFILFCPFFCVAMCEIANSGVFIFPVYRCRASLSKFLCLAWAALFAVIRCISHNMLQHNNQITCLTWFSFEINGLWIFVLPTIKASWINCTRRINIILQCKIHVDSNDDGLSIVNGWWKEWAVSGSWASRYRNIYNNIRMYICVKDAKY